MSRTDIDSAAEATEQVEALQPRARPGRALRLALGVTALAGATALAFPVRVVERYDVQLVSTVRAVPLLPAHKSFEALKVRSGTRVREGEVLATLDDSRLRAELASLMEADQQPDPPPPDPRGGQPEECGTAAAHAQAMRRERREALETALAAPTTITAPAEGVFEITQLPLPELVQPKDAPFGRIVGQRLQVKGGPEVQEAVVVVGETSVPVVRSGLESFQLDYAGEVEPGRAVLEVQLGRQPWLLEMLSQLGRWDVAGKPSNQPRLKSFER